MIKTDQTALLKKKNKKIKEQKETIDYLVLQNRDLKEWVKFLQQELRDLK